MQLVYSINQRIIRVNYNMIWDRLEAVEILAHTYDFKNNMVCIMTEDQQWVDETDNLRKVAYNSFIQEQYRDRNSFTWDNETFAINQDYECHEDCIRTKDDFLPELILPMSKLSESFDELIAIMGYGR